MKSAIPAVILCMLIGCASLKGTLTPSELSKEFYEPNNWITLPIPDSKVAPGALVEIDAKGLRYISHLTSCGVPPEVVAVKTGNSPALSFTKNGEYGLNVLAKLTGVEIGPNFDRTHKVILEHKKHGGDAIDLIIVSEWLTKPGNRVNDACNTFFDSPKGYLVQEAYRVSEGSYQIVSSAGVEVKTGDLPAGAITLKADAKAKWGQDGKLVFTEPVYTAIRRVRRVNGVLQTLNSVGGNSDDDVKNFLVPLIEAESKQ